MKPVRIFRHVDCEGPGYLAEFLDRHDVPWEQVSIDAGERVPATLDDVSGLVFMGGGMSVNDDLSWIGDELALIRRAADRGLPLLGHCLGGQLIAKALGGGVTQNRVTEIGWFDVERVDNEAAAQWLDGLPDSFEVFHWHGETFSLPEGAERILRNASCENQAFVKGNILALQCHVEMTEALVSEWAERFAHQLQTSETVQGPSEITRDLAHRMRRLHDVADKLYGKWIKNLHG